jgi:ABC-type amino acid transport substrate-binding protein
MRWHNLFIIISTSISAAAQDQPIQVLCSDFPQIVVKNDTTESPVYTGFLIDIWEAIAKQEGWQYVYQPAPSSNESEDYYHAAFQKLEKS